MAGFIDAAVQDIDNRLKELKEEEGRLQAARSALVGPGRRGPGRPPRAAAAAAAATPAKSGSTARRRPGRIGYIELTANPRIAADVRGNTRSAQALELVRSKPGITIPDIATAMKIEPNYLYRVMPKLTADGLIKRDGQGWHPVEAA